MLIITVPGGELFDENTLEFIYPKETVLKLEHSLVSISKWESRWNVPFLTKKSRERSTEETMDYIKCMTINPVDDTVYKCLTRDNIEAITRYVEAPMTATKFNDYGMSRPSREIVTSEIIYYWMILYNIPFECEKWHISRLMTLIKVCSEKAKEQNGSRKMTKSAIISQNQALNAQRRAKLNSKG